jgi:hypothetical protein
MGKPVNLVVCHGTPPSHMEEVTWVLRRHRLVPHGFAYDPISIDFPDGVLIVPSYAELDEAVSLHVRLASHLLRPICMVPPLSASAVRRLRATPAHVDVIWSDEVRTRLPHWAAELPSAPWPVIRSLLISRAKGDFLIRRACAILFAPAPAPTSVVALADNLSVKPHALRYYWRTRIGKPPLKELMQWLTLMRAVGLRSRDQGWLPISRQLDVHTRTLERISKQLIGRPLSQAVEEELVNTAFRDWFRETLKPTKTA